MDTWIFCLFKILRIKVDFGKCTLQILLHINVALIVNILLNRLSVTKQFDNFDKMDELVFLLKSVQSNPLMPLDPVPIEKYLILMQIFNKLIFVYWININ